MRALHPTAATSALTRLAVTPPPSSRPVFHVAATYTDGVSS